MTKNDSPSAILLCTSIITILLTNNIIYSSNKYSLPEAHSLPKYLSVTKNNYPIMNCTLLQLQ